MTNDRPYDQLRESAWRRKLTPAEESDLRDRLSASPELQADWEAETALNQALEHLPAAEVSSNFTTQVLQAVQRDGFRRSRPSAWLRVLWAPRLRWLPTSGLAAVCLAVTAISYHHLQESRRVRLAESVITVSKVAQVPSPDVLADFDAIRVLDRTPPPDEELLRLMQ